jgi:hypothetical protein
MKNLKSHNESELISHCEQGGRDSFCKEKDNKDQEQVL